MLLVEVDALDAKTPKRALDRGPDVPGRALRPDVGDGGLRPGVAELGRNDRLVPEPRERSTEAGLAESVLRALHIGGIEEVHPGVEGGVHDGVRPRLIDGERARSTEVVAAESDDADA